MDETPTPKGLRELASWFDNPNESPPVTVNITWDGTVTAGYLTRRVADALEEANRTQNKEADDA